MRFRKTDYEWYWPFRIGDTLSNLNGKVKLSDGLMNLLRGELKSYGPEI